MGVASQMRAHLQLAIPGAVGLFAETDSPVSLRFLARFESRDRADWLTPARLAKWLSSIGYSGRSDPAGLHTRLTAAPRDITGHDAAFSQSEHSRRSRRHYDDDSGRESMGEQDR